MRHKIKEYLTRYKLRLSNDLGQSYADKGGYSTNLTQIKKDALKLDKDGSCRWVIVDECDEPRYWSQYHEANLQAPAGTAIMTLDPYLRKLAVRKGYELVEFSDYLRSMGVSESDIKQAISKSVSMADVRKTLPIIQGAIEEGKVSVLQTDFDDSCVGEKLFGD